MEDSNKTKKGGFLWFGTDDTFGGTIKKTKTSETKLINRYEELDKVTKEYHEAYDNHLKNLITLDDFANFHGMEKLFQKVIMKDAFKRGKVDRSAPLLFKNYLIEDETTPRTFRKEHIIRQVEYVLKKHFAGREHMYIKTIKIEDLGKNEFILHIVTIENIKRNRKIGHSNYIIDMAKTRAFLKETLESTKKNLKRRSTLIEIGSKSSRSSSSDSTKSKKHSKKHSKRTKRSKRTKKSRSRFSVFGNNDNSNASSRQSTSNTINSEIELGTLENTKSSYKKTLNAEKQYKPGKSDNEAKPNTVPKKELPITGIITTPGDIVTMQPTDMMAPKPINNAKRAKCNQYLDTANCNNDTDCFWNTRANRCFVNTREKKAFPTANQFKHGPALTPQPPSQNTGAPPVQQQQPAPAPPVVAPLGELLLNDNKDGGMEI
jgi:hypothetical protein